jgi:hypothetical protein
MIIKMFCNGMFEVLTEVTKTIRKNVTVLICIDANVL